MSAGRAAGKGSAPPGPWGGSQTNSVRSTRDALHIFGRKKLPQTACVGFIILMLSSVDPFLMRADGKVLCRLQGQPTVQGLASRLQGPDHVSPC